MQRENLTSARLEIDKHAVMFNPEELRKVEAWGDEKELVMIGVLGIKSLGDEIVYMLEY